MTREAKSSVDGNASVASVTIPLKNVRPQTCEYAWPN